MDQEQVWDEIASTWNEYKTESFGSRDGLIEEFVSESDKVLDLGCGSGRNFISKGSWYGVDFSAKMLEFASSRGYVELKKCDLWDVDFEDFKFDKVVCIATLHCVSSATDRLDSLREIYRLLRKGGEAIITVWNKDSKRWKNKDKDVVASWDTGSEKVDRNYYLYSPEELRRDLESVGFKVVSENYSLARNIVVRVLK